MISIDIQELLKNGESRYELVVATAKRARMIVDKTKAKSIKEEKAGVKVSAPIEKPVTVAVEEFMDKKWSIVRDNNTDESAFI